MPRENCFREEYLSCLEDMKTPCVCALVVFICFLAVGIFVGGLFGVLANAQPPHLYTVMFGVGFCMLVMIMITALVFLIGSCVPKRRRIASRGESIV
jgi:hypothetical protein